MLSWTRFVSSSTAAALGGGGRGGEGEGARGQRPRVEGLGREEPPRALGVPGWLSARGTSASARRCHARPRVAAPAARASRSAEAGASRRRPGPKMLRASGLSALTARSGRAAPVRAPSWGRAVAWPAGWVCLVSSSPLPFLPPSSVLSSLPAHSLGCCETSPLLRSRLPATASSNEHLCLAFNGPLLLSLLLSARFVDVVGSVL